MNRFIQTAGVAAGLLSLGACASVTRGTTTAWEVKTTPPGASVRTTNGMACDSTPCSIVMSRKSKFSATIAKAGYKPVTVQVTTKIGNAGGAALAGNVLIGGLIGIGIDATTGAMNDLTPNPVDLTLEKDDGAPPATAAPAEPPKTDPVKADAPKPDAPKADAPPSSDPKPALEAKPATDAKPAPGGL